MKQKLFVWICILIVEAGTFGINAQSIVVKMKDGTENFRNLGSLQNFTFSNNNLLLKFTNGTTEMFSLFTVSKLYFSSTTVNAVSLENIVSDKDYQVLSAYPNPTDNIIYIQNLPKNIEEITIYRMDGLLVLHAQISSTNPSVSVSNLRSGLYFIKVNNQVLKFIKS